VARSSSLPLVDRILDGRLTQEMTERRANGDSYNAIARWLAVEHDLEPTGETVRQWCLALDVDKVGPEEKAAS